MEDALYDLVKDVLDDMPTVKTLIWSTQGAGKPPVSDRFKDFDAWYQAFPATEPDTVLNIDDPCQMTYTSGTESLPKGVIISNQALMSEYMGAIIDGGYESDDISVNALPIFHCAQRDVFLNPMFWIGAHQHPGDAGNGQDPENHRGLQGHRVFRAPNGLDRAHAPSGF